MADSTIWWILAGAAVAVEMVTGSFYLLMLGIGMAAGAVAAHAGLGMALQIVVAAVIGGGATVGWHLMRQRRAPEAAAAANPDVNIDVGEQVHVETWNADHTASVRYRGAAWTVVPFGGTPQGAGAHRVREVLGNRLVVEKI